MRRLSTCPAVLKQHFFPRGSQRSRHLFPEGGKGGQKSNQVSTSVSVMTEKLFSSLLPFAFLSQLDYSNFTCSDIFAATCLQQHFLESATVSHIKFKGQKTIVKHCFFCSLLLFQHLCKNATERKNFIPSFKVRLCEILASSSTWSLRSIDKS